MAILKLQNNVVVTRFSDVPDMRAFVRRYGSALGLGLDLGEVETPEGITGPEVPVPVPDVLEADGATYMAGDGWPGQLYQDGAFVAAVGAEDG